MSSRIPSAALMRAAGYDLCSEIGRSRSAVVLRVRRLADGKDYALKIVDRSGSGREEQSVASFRREAVLLAGVDHPHIARIHEVGEIDDRPYLVMDLVEGTTLTQVLQGGPLSPPRVVVLARELLQILAAAHRAGVIHRDLKPDNIIVGPDGATRLIDFGLATRHKGRDDAEPSHADQGPTDQSLADQGPGETDDRAVGTLLYAPPEQSGTLRRQVDHRSDLYSLGVVLHQCLSGEPPFADTDVGELLRSHAVSPPPDLAVVAGAPPPLAALVAKLLAKDPDDRFQCANAVLTDVALNTPDTDPDASPDTATGPDRGVGTEAPGPAAATTRRRSWLFPTCGAPPVEPVGQERPQRTLLDRWRQADRGTGSVCVVRGGDGIGKTAQARRLTGLVTAQGAVAITGAASPDDTTPLLPIRLALGNYLAAGQSISEDEASDRIQRLRAAAGVDAAVLATAWPGLFQDDDTNAGSAEAVADQLTVTAADQLTVAAADLLTSLATDHQGLLLVIDDGHWADWATLAALDLLARKAADLPFLVVVTWNDEAVPRCPLIDTAGVIDLPLAPLDRTAVAAIIADTIPGVEARDPLVRLVSNTADGNPLVVNEYLRAIVDAGLVAPDWGRWALDETGLAALDLPADALGLLIQRLDELPPDATEVLLTAATAGNRFDAGLVADAHPDRSAADVANALAVAANRHLVERTENGGYQFVHRRLRTVLLANMTADGMAQRHAALALALAARDDGGTEPTTVQALARHCMAAGDSVPNDLAVDACRAAGEHALAALAHEDAIEVLYYAAEVTEKPSARLHQLLGAALKEAGRFHDATVQLDRALELETDRLHRAEILWIQAEAHRSAWQIPQGVAAAERAMAELGAPTPRSPLGHAATTIERLVQGTLLDLIGRHRPLPRGDTATRYELLAGAHRATAHLRAVDRSSTVLPSQAIQARYWASRVGQGRQFVEAQVLYGAVLTEMGLGRLAQRAFRRARRDPTADEPAQATALRFGPAWAAYSGYHDGLDRWLLAVEERAHQVDLASFCDSASSLILALLAEGRDSDANRLLGLAQDRIRRRRGEPHPVLAWSAAAAAVAGRHTDAASELDRHRATLDLSRGAVAAQLADVTISVLFEQGETGPPFDAAVADRFLRRSSRSAQRSHRWPWYLAALGRIDQLRAADRSDRAERLRLAQSAVTDLAPLARDDTGRAWYAIARADLQVASGEPLAAVRQLNDLDRSHCRLNPRNAFDATATRARAWYELGDRDRAHWQAELAALIAARHGWHHRATRLAAAMPDLELERPSISSSVPAPRPTIDVAASGHGWGLDRQRLQAFQQVGAAASRILDPDALARIVLDELVTVLHAGRAHLFVTDQHHHLVHHLGRDADGRDLARPEGYASSLVERVGRTGEPLVVAGTDHGAALGSDSAVQHGLRSIILAPLLLEDRLIGVLYLDSQTAKGIFSTDDADILLALGGHIALSLETARAAQLEISVQAAHRQRDMADRLRIAFEEISDTLDPDIVLTRLLHWTTELVAGARACLVSSGQSPELIIRYGDDQLERTILGPPDQPEIPAELPTAPASERPTGADPTGEPGSRTEPGSPDGLEPAGEPAATDEPAAWEEESGLLALQELTEPTVLAPPNLPPLLLTVDTDAQSWLAVPLRSRATEVGTLLLAFATPSGAWDSEVELVAALVAQGLTAYDNASLFAQVQEKAVVDELTGINNRRRFLDLAGLILAEAGRFQRSATVLMIDIDHFKQVNDTHGHPTGDDVIRQVAERIDGLLRGVDVVARYGGEEFAAVLPDTGLAASQVIAERLRVAVASEPIATRTEPVSVTISIGVAQARGRTAVEDVLADADRALYRAKQEGRNRVACVDHDADSPRSAGGRSDHLG
jgi:diguanylate cyclase (GGDEF)-like protein